MNYSDRGPGLLGLIRWECYCLGLDPETMSVEYAMGYVWQVAKLSVNQATITEDPPAANDRQITQLVARAAWKEANAAKLAPMAIHWNKRLPIVPTIGPEGKD